MSNSYEEDQIRKMIKLPQFTGQKSEILKLLRSAKRKREWEGAVFGIYLSMKGELTKKQEKEK